MGLRRSIFVLGFLSVFLFAVACRGAVARIGPLDGASVVVAGRMALAAPALVMLQPALSGLCGRYEINADTHQAPMADRLPVPHQNIPRRCSAAGSGE